MRGRTEQIYVQNPAKVVIEGQNVMFTPGAHT